MVFITGTEYYGFYKNTRTILVYFPFNDKGMCALSGPLSSAPCGRPVSLRIQNTMDFIKTQALN